MTALEQALGAIPTPISKALEREYVELESRFARRDWAPAQLNGGRLAEAILRYLEWKSTGSFTPLGAQINRSVIVNKHVAQDTKLPDGIRFHVRSCAELLMDIRNKRDVAHLGPVIDVAEMDAHLVMRLAAWSLAEIIREESGLPSQEVQRLIDRLSSRHLALVEEIHGDLVVVATDLPAADRALVALYHRFPEGMAVVELAKAIGYKNRSRFSSKVLPSKDAEKLLHLAGDWCVLTRKGVAWVESHIDFRLDI